MSTPSLTDFLLARIEARERVARNRLTEWEARGMSERMLRLSPDSPRLMLAECEAKRRIVEACDGFDEQGLRVRQLLALPYADHPDYDESWRP